VNQDAAVPPTGNPEADLSEPDGTQHVGRADIAYRALEEQIVTLRLPPGMMLSEQTLSRKFGVGRTPVREALQRLENEGLVVILPRRGVLVSEIDVKRQFRMLELRREVDRFVVTKACLRATEAECREFEEIARAMENAAETGDVEAFIRADKWMDRAVYEAARNEFATKTLQLMSGLTRRFWYSYHTTTRDVASCATMHARIVKALASRDQETARRAADDLLDYLMELLHSSLEKL